jgi:hypothetical protein
MDQSFQQRVTEADFVSQVDSQPSSTVDRLARVGDYRVAGGGEMVYYAVEAGGQGVGYVVYLNKEGRVLKIE